MEVHEEKHRQGQQCAAQFIQHHAIKLVSRHGYHRPAVPCCLLALCVSDVCVYSDTVSDVCVCVLSVSDCVCVCARAVC